MNKKVILKLLNSSNLQDKIIALNMIAELPDPRAFFRKNGRILINQKDSDDHLDKGPRYTIRTKYSIQWDCYYKISSDYYIVLNNYEVSECYEAYFGGWEVINHKEQL